MILSNVDLEDKLFMTTYREVVQRLKGKLRFCLKGRRFFSNANRRYGPKAILNRPSYALQISYNRTLLLDAFPDMFIHCLYEPDEGLHYIYYRPARLNGRHVVDVLRALYGPADVSEAELDRVRRDATKRGKSVARWGKKWTDMWETV